MVRPPDGSTSRVRGDAHLLLHAGASRHRAALHQPAARSRRIRRFLRAHGRALCPGARPAQTPGTGPRMTRLWLIRHGAHDWLGRALVGRAPGVTLNFAGHEQARRIAAMLAGEPLAAIYSSPLERARETA